MREDRKGTFFCASGEAAAFDQRDDVGMGAVFVLFLRWPDLYHQVYVACGLIALLGAAAIIGFPHLHEGKARYRLVLEHDLN